MEYYQILAIVIACVVVIAVCLVVILLLRKGKNKANEEFPDLLLALGGKENISEVSYKGSRVSVLVDNKKVIDKEKIKEQGVETIVISNKKVTMVVGSKKAVLVYNYLNDEPNS